MLHLAMTDFLDLLRQNAALRGQALELRDRLIVEARDHGVAVTEIAEASDLSRMQVHRILHGPWRTVFFTWPGQTVGSLPVISVYADEDGNLPTVLIDPTDREGGVMKGRWLYDGHSDDTPTAIYRLADEDER